MSDSLYIQDLRTALQNSVGAECLAGATILVTGATGLIGSFLVDMLLRATEDGLPVHVLACGRNIHRLRQRFAHVRQENLTLLEQDITKPFANIPPADYVIHAASHAHPAAFNTDPVGTILGNVNGTYNILNYAANCGCRRVLYVSSGEVYGRQNSGEIIAAYPEDFSGYVDSTQPRSCYPAAKRCTETLCVAYAKQYGVETVIARPCHTYGPYTTASDNRANVQFVQRALRGEDILLNSAGTQLRSYCYVADCASAIITILLNGKAGQAYNIANPNSRVTIAGFAHAVAAAAAVQVCYTDPDAVALAERSPIEKQVLDSTKLEDLGWQGLYSISLGIEHTIRILQTPTNLH